MPPLCSPPALIHPLWCLCYFSKMFFIILNGKWSIIQVTSFCNTNKRKLSQLQCKELVYQCKGLQHWPTVGLHGRMVWSTPPWSLTDTVRYKIIDFTAVHPQSYYLQWTRLSSTNSVADGIALHQTISALLIFLSLCVLSSILFLLDINGIVQTIHVYCYRGLSACHQCHHLQISIL